jgi:hypothetical protein
VDFPMRQFVEIADPLGDSDVRGFDSSREAILDVADTQLKHLDGLGVAHRDDPAAFDFLHLLLREPLVGPLLERPGVTVTKTGRAAGGFRVTGLNRELRRCVRSCVPMAEAVGWIAHRLGWQAPTFVPRLYPIRFGYRWRETIL